MNIASIDIGTNTVIMLIAEFDLIQKQIKVILNDQKIPRIGQGLKPGKPISSKKEILLIDILESFKKIATYHNCEKILVTATNAFRVASNSGSIVKNIKRVLNLDIKIASSEEEARLTYLGCTGGFQLDKTLCVIDIGGGSTEISFGSNNNFNSFIALPLGVVSLTEKYFAAKHRKNDELFNCRDKITAELLKLGKSKVNIERCLAVAGTPTTLACLKKGMTEYFEEQIEGQVLTKSDLIEFVDELSTLNPNEIRVKYNNVVQGREDLILTGTLLLLQCLEYLDIEMVEVSTRGLRYGRIYEFFTNDY